MRSPILLLMRMNAAETSASSAIADWTPLTVVPRSWTTYEMDTFISDVSTTRTNIAAASRIMSRVLPAVAGAAVVACAVMRKRPSSAGAVGSPGPARLPPRGSGGGAWERCPGGTLDREERRHDAGPDPDGERREADLRRLRAVLAPRGGVDDLLGRAAVREVEHARRPEARAELEPGLEVAARAHRDG